MLLETQWAFNSHGNMGSYSMDLCLLAGAYGLTYFITQAAKAFTGSGHGELAEQVSSRYLSRITSLLNMRGLELGL